MTIEQDFNLKPEISREFLATGIIANNTFNTFMCGNLRVAVENVGGGNVVVVKGRIAGQSTFQTLATITGATTGTTVDISVVDEIQFDCTTYSASGGTPKLLASGFFKRGGSTAPAGFGFYAQQNGTTLIDQATVAGDNTVNIALNAADYVHGTLGLVIPASGSFGSAINVNKKNIFATVNYFSTTINDAYSEIPFTAPYDVYPGYLGTTFWPRAYTSLRNSALSQNNLSSTGGFSGGVNGSPVIFLKSCRINGANIELVFNSGGTGAIVFDCFWRVWKISA
jgi:hypothetical protein